MLSRAFHNFPHCTLQSGGRTSLENILRSMRRALSSPSLWTWILETVVLPAHEVEVIVSWQRVKQGPRQLGRILRWSGNDRGRHSRRMQSRVFLGHEKARRRKTKKLGSLNPWPVAGGEVGGLTRDLYGNRNTCRDYSWNNSEFWVFPYSSFKHR